ncbi:Nif3-like dinuclear metal center hexameric protein [Pallidibacillus pasinlerensis]|uniref:GTP cyclohydrolase 1 type 2 homolog n=1 Tax=Pallidibacillus pasinlerensis TaxID=2703818 RepID=A0ABX0ABC7_9BACI|nr:Nif3-like dinuclear metal center hexameric protein [Pallidibacillus pasinlerensis]NCU18730.1 Nif3-like dinuclear metal center hexameric protein [Pallidibacillus pasinlerensis]
MKHPNGHEIIQLFEQFAPKHLAMDGDKIGLLVGSLNQTVKNVLIALDVTEDVVDEAIANDVQLIIAHHPLIFNPLKTIRTEDAYGKIISKLIKHDIAVYAAHTNLDIAKGGVNDMLADILGVKNTEVLVPTYEEPLKKLVVYAPVEDAEKIRKTLGDYGAGHIGDYSHCSFSNEGTGRFLPGENTNPHIGTVGQLEAVREERIETVFPASIEKRLIKAMLKAHPYEEPAYDIYPLDLKGETYGLGRIGYLDEEMTLEEFALFVKKQLDVTGVRVTGNLQDKVKKVAIVGGDGGKYYTTAIRKGADVFITGDMYYHTAIDAKLDGLNLIDPGHNVEKVMKQGVADKLTEMCEEKKLDVNIIPSKINTDPFYFL